MPVSFPDPHTAVKDGDGFCSVARPVSHKIGDPRPRAVERWHGPQGYIALLGPIRDGFGGYMYKTPYRGKIYRYRVVGL